MYETVFTIKRNLEGDMIIAVDNHQAWKVSKGLRDQILREIKGQIDGEYNSVALQLFERIVCV